MQTHNTNPLVRLQGTSAAMGFALAAPVANPTQRCVLVLLASCNYGIGVDPAELRRLPRFANVKPSAGDKAIAALLDCSLIEQDANGRFYLVGRP